MNTLRFGVWARKKSCFGHSELNILGFAFLQKEHYSDAGN